LGCGGHVALKKRNGQSWEMLGGWGYPKVGQAESFKECLCCFDFCQVFLEFEMVDGLGFFNLAATAGLFFFELALTEGFFIPELA
jgi:hypothetical protein